MGPAASYLAATRREQPAFLGRSYYRNIFDSLQARLRIYGATPDFDLTYSSERTCETIRSGGATIVIYDQYLGQTFNQFNRLQANAETPFESLVYAYKIAAEFAEIDGQPHLAAKLAIAHATNREKALSHRKDVNLARRLQAVALQESYVIAHEAFHTIVEHQVEWRIRMIQDSRADFINNYYLRAIQQSQEFGDPDFDLLWPVYLRQMERFLRDDALVEECICDTLAITTICPYPDGKADLAQLELTRDAIFFALRYLRLLALIRNSVREQRSDHQDSENWLDPYLVRNQFLQWTLGQFPALQPLRTPEGQARFEETQARYSTFLEDPVLYQLPLVIKALADSDIHLPPDVFSISDLLGNDPERVNRLAAMGEESYIVDATAITQENYDRIRRGFDPSTSEAALDVNRDRNRRET